MALKESWKTVLTDFVQFSKSFGKTSLETVQAGAKALDRLIEDAVNPPPKKKHTKTDYTAKAQAPFGEK